jgi:hypothetical protein
MDAIEPRGPHRAQLLCSHTSERPRTRVGGDALRVRESLSQSQQYRDEFGGRHHQGVGILQEDRPHAGAIPVRDGPHPRHLVAVGGRGEPPGLETIDEVGDGVDIAKDMLQRAAGETGALVHPAETAAVPGTVAADPYEQAVGLARRPDGALLYALILWVHVPRARSFRLEAQKPPTSRAAAFLSRSSVI